MGYIIGPRIAGVIFAGGVFSWLVMMPAIKFFGSLVPTAIYPSTIPIAQMTSGELWNFYIRYIGAGAVAAAGLNTLGKTLKPEAVLFATALPKTRNAKVMRRLIRVAHLEVHDVTKGPAPLGDISALENPEALDAIRKAY